MKTLCHRILPILIIFSFFASTKTFAQTTICGLDRTFFGGKVFYSSDPAITVQYASVNNSFDFPDHDVNIPLLMDIYKPAGVTRLKPVILLMHSGSYRVGCKEDNEMTMVCGEFVKRGFIAVSVAYRLGWVDRASTCSINGTTFTDNGDNDNDISDETCSGRGMCASCGISSPLDSAIYRGVQDMKAALRYIKHYAADYQVDTNNIYIGGMSAGSMTSVMTAYMQQQDFDNALGIDYRNNLGSIDSSGVDPISGTVLTDTYKLAGVFNNWGAVLDTTYINDIPEDRVPIISFHGICDETIPYKSGNFSCDLVPLYGSYSIYKRIQNLGMNVSHVLLSKSGGHGIYKCKAGVQQRVGCAVAFFRATSAKVYHNDIVECLPEFCGDSKAGCSNQCKTTVAAVQPVNEDEHSKNISSFVVYPNPATDYINLSYKLEIASDVSLKLLDGMGNVKYTTLIHTSPGTNSFKIPLKLEKGIYYVYLESAGNIYKASALVTSK